MRYFKCFYRVRVLTSQNSFFNGYEYLIVVLLFPSLLGLIRGVYLATVFYHKDNILVTAEDQIPLVDIQCCSTSITQDFAWFAKVS